MNPNFLSLVSESKSLNSKIFSLIRLQIMANLYVLRNDGATYRELKASLAVSDGALFTNLRALKAMGYVQSHTVDVENKKLEAYVITPDGIAEWKRVQGWLCKFCHSESENKCTK